MMNAFCPKCKGTLTIKGDFEGELIPCYGCTVIGLRAQLHRTKDNYLAYRKIHGIVETPDFVRLATKLQEQTEGLAAVERIIHNALTAGLEDAKATNTVRGESASRWAFDTLYCIARDIFRWSRVDERKALAEFLARRAR